MKGYESITKNFVMKRTPTIIRLDGRAFHTYVKHINPANDPSMVGQPFSHNLHYIMTNVVLHLAEEIQNVKIGYTQSDEITLLLTDWEELTTEQWFNGNIQKMTSVSAAIASVWFNKYWVEVFGQNKKLATFDSRVFNIPKEEVCNNFIWRQQDASRNSVQMLGHYHFSQKQMHGLNNSQVQDLLMLNKGINWNDVDTWKKRGSCIIKQDNGKWCVDENIPIFTQDRNYINQYVFGEE